jgi:predicted DNA-binding ribbon-helix-helix protein
MPKKKAKPKARMRTFNVRVSGRRTTVRMEPEIWDAFNEICQREDCTLDDICASLNKVRGRSSLASALRVFIVTYFRKLVAEVGHAKAGHRDAAMRARPASKE